MFDWNRRDATLCSVCEHSDTRAQAASQVRCPVLLNLVFLSSVDASRSPCFYDRRLMTVSNCFRAEDGTNKHDKGIYRVHQFTKVSDLLFVPTSIGFSHCFLSTFFDRYNNFVALV